MDVKTLRSKKLAFLSSNESKNKQFGIAYKNIEEEWNRSSRRWLSEEVDLSDAAKRYYSFEKSEYKKDKDPERLVRMTAATDFFVKTLSKRDTKKILVDNIIRDFDEARQKLSKHHRWNKIDPKIVEEILE